MSHTTTPSLSMSNYFSTSLTAPITTSDTIFFLNAVPTAAEGFLELDEGLSTKEIIYYTSVGANFVTCPDATSGSGRGVGGTSPAAHASGATVKQKVNAEYWKALQNGQSMGAGSIATSNLATGIQVATKAQDPYKFSVYRNAAQNTGAGSDAKVNFDTKTFDTGSNVDIVTNVGRFTAPVAGFYQINAHVGCASGTYLIATLYKNGSVFKNGTLATSSSGSTGSSISDLVQLAANDYLEVFSQANIAKAIDTGSINTYFSGFLVSAT